MSGRTDAEGPRRRLLDRLPDARRSAVMNLFLAEIREHGATMSEGLVQSLTARVAAEVDALEQARQWDDAAKWSTVHHAIRGYPAEALDLARAALEWEAMPFEARRR